VTRVKPFHTITMMRIVRRILPSERPNIASPVAAQRP
jgi:hypothetical protein